MGCDGIELLQISKVGLGGEKVIGPQSIVAAIEPRSELVIFG